MTSQRPGRVIVVPPADAPFHEIWEFALTWNAYMRHGSAESVGEFANRIRGDFFAGLPLPEDLASLRTALFFEQRRAHHFASPLRDGTRRYVIALLEKIRGLTGGQISGRGDPLP
ncbi:MAG: hypothetical protein JST73_01035 [Actinobacteria bacterium]|nr:hypothetical protein [Actinomycetota bacterium]